ncbi:MAG: hypothetical protein WA126_12050 [Thermodesulfovibrionales bacterium]
MKAKDILIYFKVFTISIVLLCFLSNCAAVRTVGRVHKGVGDALVTSADEEEAKRAKNKNNQQTTKSGSKSTTTNK